MALPDWVAGATRPVMTPTWYRKGTTTPEDLSAATLTGTITNRRTGVVRAIVGALAVTDGPNGEFSWALDAADAVAGEYVVQFNAAFGSSPTPARSFESEWLVTPYNEVT